PCAAAGSASREPAAASSAARRRPWAARRNTSRARPRPTAAIQATCASTGAARCRRRRRGRSSEPFCNEQPRELRRRDSTRTRPGRDQDATRTRPGRDQGGCRVGHAYSQRQIVFREREASQNLRVSRSMSIVNSGRRVLLIDPTDRRREILCRRLRAQGYLVDETADAAAGAHMALSAPPAAVIADLWMPGVSGVQLCRLLGSEPATADVPVVLCVERDEPRSRFWADRAGAAACVLKGRTGELVRALAKAVDTAPHDGGFFVQLSGGSIDIRDRLARHLDEALFDSVIAAELRALAHAGNFERLFDLLAQLLSQITRYRWIALASGT